MGILATFTTWSMISAISDQNAHCLLRSSMGQYVTTLSPRLVVTSVYLFLLWFLLFVVDIVAVSNPLLWALLLWVAFMFFSIVIPLSAFGRLVLHTGAMAQKPVLSGDLEKELLPNGLHASLVIHGGLRRGMHRFMGSDGTMFASDEEQNILESDSMVCTEAERPSSMGALSVYSSAAPAEEGGKDPTARAGTLRDGEVSFRHLHTAASVPPSYRSYHRRLQTSDTAIDLPPAAILNMSLTGKEFKELINNAMDTSSVGEEGRLEQVQMDGECSIVERIDH
ncbi:MAG: hypothetical protein SGARI_001694, partial [Bacillariaceae sp.]